ncbi:MAG: hypothetical protein ABI446_05760 [Gemmatimonadaceae bacterium]
MKCLAVLLAGLAFSTNALQAQNSRSSVPESHRPPAGMCRIWIDGVPPAHQPAPTDCATAIRKRPMNARVVFGSDVSGGNSQSNTQGNTQRNPRVFTPAAPPVSSFAQPSAPSEPQQQQQQQRDEIEHQRIEAQRVRDEQERRVSHQSAPPPPPAPPPRPRIEKTSRPPRQSFSPRRPR